MSGPIVWISKPTCIVADSAERIPEPAEHLTYRRVYEAHGKPWVVVPHVGPVPDAGPATAEELARQALIPLLVRHGPADVEIFVDCRSGAMLSGPAPTYRLAISAGLTTAAPVCLWGQDGPEVAFGISTLARRLSEQGTAIVSTCQRVTSPDTRAPAWTNLLLGDAAAALLLSRRRLPGGRPVLAVRIGPAGRADLLAGAFRAAGLAEEPEWTLTTDPTASHAAGHSRWPNIFFGVADILVKLAEHSAGHSAPGVGALVMHGRAGTSAVMILGMKEHDAS
jgi:hypothetical protein